MFAALPEAFHKLRPNVRVIVDFTEVYFETPISLEVQANLWSDYKHHCTSKFLVANTSNGAISWYLLLMVVAQMTELLDLMEPYDTVMTDKGFKLKSALIMKRCYLAIPLSATQGTQW